MIHLLTDGTHQQWLAQGKDLRYLAMICFCSKIKSNNTVMMNRYKGSATKGSSCQLLVRVAQVYDLWTARDIYYRKCITTQCHMWTLECWGTVLSWPDECFHIMCHREIKNKKMSVKSNQWLKKTGLRATQTSSVLSVSELWCCQLHHQCPLSHCYPPSLLICPKTSTLLLWLHLEPLQNQLYFKDTSVSSALPPPSSIPPTFRQWRFHLCFCWPQGLEHIPLCFLCFLQLYSFTCVTPSPALFFLCDLSHHQPKTAVLQSLHYEPPMSHNSLYGHNFLWIKGVDSPHTDIATVKLGLASTYLKCSLFIIRGNIVLHINY